MLFNLLFESTTVSQFLAKEQDKVKSFKPKVKTFLNDFPGTGNRERLMNWFIKELIVQEINPNIAKEVLSNWWDNIGDWLVTNFETFRSKLNTVAFTYANAIAESEAWHEKLANKASSKIEGEVGREVVSLDDVPGFNGWKWVALDKKFCSKEAKAMGHCGNSAGHERDNILSLRDPKNFPYLTFINNKGALGEMKGKGNSKPSSKYHPAIIKLLLSNEVGTIVGGGHAPQNNFALADLTKDQQEQIKAAKPYIDKPDLFRKERNSLLGQERKKYFDKLSKQIETSPEAAKDAVKLIMTGLSNHINMWDSRNDSNKIDRANVDLDSNDYDTDIDSVRTQNPKKKKKSSRLDSFSFFLNETYKKSKQEPDPQKLFSWMDNVITAMISVFIETDLTFYNNLPEDSKTYFRNHSLIIMLDELINELYKKQPDILRAAPKRNRYKSFDEYTLNLKKFLIQYGVELPPFKPQSNMISYEFIVKAGQELAKQTKSSGLLDILSK